MACGMFVAGAILCSREASRESFEDFSPWCFSSGLLKGLLRYSCRLASRVAMSGFGPAIPDQLSVIAVSVWEEPMTY